MNRVVIAATITARLAAIRTPPKITIGSPVRPDPEHRGQRGEGRSERRPGSELRVGTLLDLMNWTAVAPPFTATSETLTHQFDVDVTGHCFRIRQVPCSGTGVSIGAETRGSGDFLAPPRCQPTQRRPVGSPEFRPKPTFKPSPRPLVT